MASSSPSAADDLTSGEKDDVLATLLRSHPQLVDAAVGEVRGEPAPLTVPGNGGGDGQDPQQQQQQQQPKAKRLPTTPVRPRPASVSTAAHGPIKDLPKKELWEHRYAQLLSYRAEHGDCRVPYKYSPDPALWRWVDNQRQAYRWRAEGKPGSWLSDERVDRLDAIGFVWNVRPERQLTFEERLEQLKQYKATHDGDTNVPLREPSGLGRWCTRQRARKDLMGDERIAQLDSLGFRWEVRPPKKSWEERMDELRAYKAENGHVNVRNEEGSRELYRWTRGMRSRYKARTDGDNTDNQHGLSDERIGELVLLGFDFKISPKEVGGGVSGPKPNKSWDEQYEALCQFKAKYGHCCPGKCPEAAKYDDLNKWMWYQRYEYHHLRGTGKKGNDDDGGEKEDRGGKGRRSKMSEERAVKLEKLDFLREVYKKDGRYFLKVDGGDGDELQEITVGTAAEESSKKKKKKEKEKKRGRPKRTKKAAASVSTATGDKDDGDGDDDGDSSERKEETEEQNPPSKKRKKKETKGSGDKSGKKAAHVKWDGKTIALGTFPVSEAEEKCARARELTAEWRKKEPWPSREWVIAELEKNGARAVQRA